MMSGYFFDLFMNGCSMRSSIFVFVSISAYLNIPVLPACTYLKKKYSKISHFQGVTDLYRSRKMYLPEQTENTK